MIFYQQEGEPNSLLMELELQIFKVFNLYLAPVDNFAKQKSVLKAFLKAFVQIDETYSERKLEKFGFFSMPLHRCFSYFLTRFLLKDMDSANLANKFAEALPSKDLEMEDVLKKISKVLVKQVSFVNEVTSRKWIYLG
jgi:hypothetical protein